MVVQAVNSEFGFEHGNVLSTFVTILTVNFCGWNAWEGLRTVSLHADSWWILKVTLSLGDLGTVKAGHAQLGASLQPLVGVCEMEEISDCDSEIYPKWNDLKIVVSIRNNFQSIFCTYTSFTHFQSLPFDFDDQLQNKFQGLKSWSSINLYFTHFTSIWVLMFNGRLKVMKIHSIHQHQLQYMYFRSQYVPQASYSRQILWPALILKKKAKNPT